LSGGSTLSQENRNQKQAFTAKDATDAKEEQEQSHQRIAKIFFFAFFLCVRRALCGEFFGFYFLVLIFLRPSAPLAPEAELTGLSTLQRVCAFCERPA